MVETRSHTSSRIALSSVEQLQTWMSNCLSNHPVCRKSWTLVSTRRKLPTQLLQVTENRDVLQLRLVTTGNIPSDNTHFTLSHCWGTIPCLSLTSDSYTAFTERIPFDLLRQTFRDAVELTNLLQCRFFVDRFALYNAGLPRRLAP